MPQDFLHKHTIDKLTNII